MIAGLPDVAVAAISAPPVGEHVVKAVTSADWYTLCDVAPAHSRTSVSFTLSVTVFGFML